MIRLLIVFTLVSLIGCKLPDRWVTGAYVNRDGDTLRIKTNRAFRVEMKEPDTTDKKQQRFTSGKWHQERRKMYLTVATESMGTYWSCVPLKVSIRHLKRPVECTEEGGGKKMNFHKVKVKKPKKKKEKRGKRGKKENPNE